MESCNESEVLMSETLEVIPTFECRDCNLHFDCKEDFSSHVDRIHNDPFPKKQKNANKTSVECPECSVSFTQKNNLMRHIRRFHDSSSSTPKVKRTFGDSQECPECCIKFTRRSNLIRHFRRFHKSLVPSALPQKPKIYACPECDTKFTKLSNCKRHVRNFHALKRELEQMMQFSFESSISLEAESISDKNHHIIEFNSECGLENDLSMDKNKSDENLNSGHSLNNDSSCDTIKLEDNFKFDYQNLSADSLEMEHECFVCHIKFNENDDLLNHVQDYHVSKRTENNFPNDKLVCSDCNKFYSTPFNLKRHMKHAHSDKVTNVVSHQNSTKLHEMKSCPLCKYSDNKINLYVHFSSIHNIPILIECQEFDTLQRFEEWRARIEEETQSTFVRISKTLSTEISRMVLACSHSETQSNDNNDFGFCPAEITVIVDSEKCTIYFVKVHVGHGTDRNSSSNIKNKNLGLENTNSVNDSS